jgi:hypothetical protein
LAELDGTPKRQSLASYLDGSASSGQEMRYKQDDCDYEQQMYRSECHVECDKSEQPQHEQNSGYSSKHDSSLIRVQLSDSPHDTIRAINWISGQTINAQGGML